MSLGDGLLREAWLVRDGYIDLPTRPGLGFEVDEQEAEQNREYAEELGGEFYDLVDGSIADW
jgi:galactonate dehydratase